MADQDREIWAMDSDGSDIVKLTDSAGGDLIAFVSDRDGNREIYIMTSDGASKQRITNSPGTDRWPSWCP